MIDIIIYEDNRIMSAHAEVAIKKYLNEHKLNIKIHTFLEYNKNLENLILSHTLKIYILDLEVPGKSGWEVATFIRKQGDWNSIIIVTTGHTEYIFKIIKSRIQLLDFIEKRGNYFKNLVSSVHQGFRLLGLNVNTTFNEAHKTTSLDSNTINYVEKIPNSNKCIIYFNDNTQIEMERSLNSFELKLGTDFEYSHRCCLVNIRNILEVNYKENLIKFFDGSSINLLSRNYKKKLKFILYQIDMEVESC